MIDPTRRSALVAAGALAAAPLATPVLAQPAWPRRPVRMVVPYAPGGSVDIVGRLVADPLSRSWGQPVVVENRAGASGTIGEEHVARSEADGYTLLLASSHIAFGHTTQVLPYDPEKDLAPIVLCAEAPFVLVVHPSVPANSLAELIALARANPGRLHYATSGPGTTAHLTAELFAMLAGINIEHVPYRGGGALMSDMLAGQVQMVFEAMSTTIPHIESGRLRPLAVTMESRAPQLPNVPTAAEADLPGLLASSWSGLCAPAGTPDAVQQRVAADVAAAMEGGVAAVLASRGFVPRGFGASAGVEPFKAYIASERRKWSEVAERAGIRPQG